MFARFPPVGEHAPRLSERWPAGRVAGWVWIPVQGHRRVHQNTPVAARLRVEGLLDEVTHTVRFRDPAVAELAMFVRRLRRHIPLSFKTILLFDAVKDSVGAANVERRRDAFSRVRRHSFSSIANDLGFTEATIGALMGHSRGTVTGRYIHTVDSLLVMAADTVAGHIQGLLDGKRFRRTTYALDRASREAALARLLEQSVLAEADETEQRMAA